MAFCRASSKGAHDHGENPLAPRRDRSITEPRSRAPPVPRAPRAASKPQSAGALSRDVWTRKALPGDASGAEVRAPSEQRRPREESPFARVSMLSRERDDTANQQFEMGPVRRGERPPSADRPDFRRGHILGQENSSNAGIHWSQVSSGEDVGGRKPARRQALQRELKAAEQVWEMAPEVERREMLQPLVARDHSRVNRLAREFAAAEDDSHPAKAVHDDGNYARKNVLSREQAQEPKSMHAPMPRGFEAGGDVPVFNRRSMLPPCGSVGGG
mmetsp:Transcript_43449/g.70405  ORF Transcript_43449/g.70405 Transcript_43449/m.70405 type:complete len:272 (+) Transcript_43449:1-816(+)